MKYLDCSAATVVWLRQVYRRVDVLRTVIERRQTSRKHFLQHVSLVCHWNSRQFDGGISAGACGTSTDCRCQHGTRRSSQLPHDSFHVLLWSVYNSNNDDSDQFAHFHCFTARRIACNAKRCTAIINPSVRPSVRWLHASIVYKRLQELESWIPGTRIFCKISCIQVFVRELQPKLGRQMTVDWTECDFWLLHWQWAYLTNRIIGISTKIDDLVRHVQCYTRSYNVAIIRCWSKLYVLLNPNAPYRLHLRYRPI